MLNLLAQHVIQVTDWKVENVLMIIAKLTQLEQTFVKSVNEDMPLITRMFVWKYHVIAHKVTFSTPMINVIMLENTPDLIVPQDLLSSQVVLKLLLMMV